MDKVIESALNYGLLGIVLIAIAWGANRVWMWTSVNAIKPAIDSHMKQQERMTDAQIGFMTTMANHAANEEKIMLTIAQTQQQIVEILKKERA